MAALLGADRITAERIAQQRRADGGRLWVANLNAPGQIVLAGADDDVAWLAANARDLGARRAIPLKVAGAFHSPLMAGAAADLESALEAADIGPPDFAVWANCSARPTASPASDLAAQLTGTVRFAETLESMVADGIGAFVDIGPGDVVAGMAKRTVPEATVLSLSSLDTVATVVRELNVQ